MDKDYLGNMCCCSKIETEGLGMGEQRRKQFITRARENAFTENSAILCDAPCTVSRSVHFGVDLVISVSIIRGTTFIRIDEAAMVKYFI